MVSFDEGARKGHTERKHVLIVSVIMWLLSFASRVLPWLPLLTVTAMTIFHIACLRGLYADGSYFALYVISQKAITTWDPARLFAQALTQWPLLAAVNLGIVNKTALLVIHSVGLLGMPAVFWCLAFFRLRASSLLWPFVCLYSVSAMGPGFFACSEALLAYSLVAAVLSIILSEHSLSKTDIAVLYIIGVALLLSYEATLFLGPLLAGAAILRQRTTKEQLFPAAVLYSASSLPALWSIAHPRLAVNLTRATDVDWLLNNPSFILSAMILTLYSIQLFGGIKSSIVRIATLGACAALLLPMSIPTHWASPVAQFGVRAFASIAVFLFGVMASYWRFIHHTKMRQIGFVVPFALLAVVVTPDYFLTLGFEGYLNQFRAAVQSDMGLISIDKTGISRADQLTYGTPQGSPALSLLLRPDSSKTIIMNPDGEWQPFDVHQDTGPKAADVLVFKALADQGDADAKIRLSKLLSSR